MDLNLDPSTLPVRASATVVMLRDGVCGLEVFLLKRHDLSDVLGGAHVFPGGKVDPDDALAEVHQRMDTPPAELHAALNEAQLDAPSAAALYVAAMREAFEETGVLFAQGIGHEGAGLAWRLLREGRTFDQVAAQLSLRLEASRLRPWSRWITPIVGGVMRKRFDTRFFIAAVPEGQAPAHDDHEAIDSAWLTPREALRRYWDGDIALAPPQIMSLAHLARHRTIDSVLAEARHRPPPLVEPEPFEHEGERFMCYPGDVNHPVAARALPGPTRLRYGGRRFEPVGGLAALLDG